MVRSHSRYRVVIGVILSRLAACSSLFIFDEAVVLILQNGNRDYRINLTSNALIAMCGDIGKLGGHIDSSSGPFRDVYYGYHDSHE